MENGREADTAARRERLLHHAGTIAALFETPWDERFNLRVWDAFVTLHEPDSDELVCLMLVQRNDSVPNEPRYTLTVAPRWREAMHEVKSLSDSEASALQLATFAHLDRADTDGVSWTMRRLTRSEKLSVVRGSIGGDRRIT